MSRTCSSVTWIIKEQFTQQRALRAHSFG